MDRAIALKARPRASSGFLLDAINGSLRLVESGLTVIVQRNSDSRFVKLGVGDTMDVSKIKYGYVYLQTEDGSPGVYTSKFVHSYGDKHHDFVAAGVVATVMIDCDANRDGVVGEDEEGKANWTWGQDGLGAIALVDNDRDPTSGAEHLLDEREPIVVRSTGLTELPPEIRVVLRTDAGGAMKFSLFRRTDNDAVKVLGRTPAESAQDVVDITDDVVLSGETLYLAAHEYPGPFFEGLLIINLEILATLKTGVHSIASDRVMIRVAPWIMTPNTQPAKQIYTCEIKHGLYNNNEFLQGLKHALDAEELPLEVIPKSIHRGDRWIQDEIEIGYTRSHRGTLPVVFDSPRDRELDAYPEIGMLGPDFGHFVVGGGAPNSLDSFGNLEVSPPVVVDGKAYPMGRIIVGGRRSDDYSHQSRQMMAEVRQFLYSQKVQFPFEVFTDWLSVAHVDEIVCFVTSEDSRFGFNALIASPALVKTILQGLVDEGHEDVLLFEGKYRYYGESAELTVKELLDDERFWDGNAMYQSFMDDTRSTLMKELGISESDIVDVPVCFKVERDPEGNLERTLAYFPDMVNHLVHQDLSIVPKPYGPIVDGQCAFEKAFEDAVPGRRVVFIDDWYSYHEQSGEVHCGTNALREPFAVSKWWEVRPEGGFDIKTTGMMD